MKRIDRLREKLAAFHAAIREELKPTADTVWDWQPSEGDTFDRDTYPCGSWYRLADGSLVIWHVDQSMLVISGPYDPSDNPHMTKAEWFAFCVELCDGEPMTAAEAAAANPAVPRIALTPDERKWLDRMPEEEQGSWLSIGG